MRGRILRQPHFRQRQKESQCGFGSLVFVAPVRVQAVAAAAGLGAVEFQSEIIPAQKPVKGALRLLMPPWVGCGAVCFQASGNRGVRFDGLLVEVRAYAVTPIESIAANGPQMAMLARSVLPPASARPEGRVRSTGF